VQHYDPLEAPDPEEWLELDEHERIELVRDYHGRARKVGHAKATASHHPGLPIYDAVRRSALK